MNRRGATVDRYGARLAPEPRMSFVQVPRPRIELGMLGLEDRVGRPARGA